MAAVLKIKLFLIKKQLKNQTSQLLETVRKKVHSNFKDDIWGGDLVDKHLTGKFNKGFRFLQCVIDIYNNYVWVIPLKKGLQLLMICEKFCKNLIASKVKYGLIKAANLIIDQ